MGERLRSRDVRNNSNKCYTVFFDEGDDEVKNAFTKSAKIKNSRSPPKKRESPKKRTKKTTIMTVADPVEDEVEGELLFSAAELVVGGDLANDATETSTNFVASDTTEVVSLSGKQGYDEVEEGAMVKVPEKVEVEKKEAEEGRKLYEASIRIVQIDQEAEKKVAGELNVGDNKIEHVVACGDEEDLKSESLQSNKNNKRKFSASLEFNSLQNGGSSSEHHPGDDENAKKIKYSSMKEQMFEIFQPWALETYGDQAKTKTITKRKKNRILEALDGKEHSNPDSSKFRFWVKSKGFTVHRPANFPDNSFTTGTKIVEKNGITAASSNFTSTITGGTEQNDVAVQRMDTQKDHIDLYVASTTKDFGERVYRKVAVVEEFFDIIYSIHVDFGGRSGRHAGQKRTYRIITETYAFLPREAVTKFLSNCPTCKKNHRPFSPSRFEDTFTESSSEFEALNYSSPNESSVDSTQTGLIKSVRRRAEGKASPLVTSSYTENFEMTAIATKCDREIMDRKFSSYYLDKVKTHVDKKTDLGDILQLRNDDHGKGSGSAGKDVEPIASNNVFKHEEKTDLDHETDVESWNFDGGMSRSTPHCYQYFKKIYTPINKNSKNKQDSRRDTKNRINLNEVTNNNSAEPYIDLTINEPSNININIGNSVEIPKASLLPHTKSFQTIPVREEYFSSFDVSINMSQASNELKISCKTTPPKKRYSIYKDKNNDQSIESHSGRTFTETPNMRVGGDVIAGPSAGYCAMNLCKKFSSESSERRHKSSTIASLVPALSTEPLRVDLSKVKPITSTYLRMTRSFGLSDEDALRIDDLESVTPSTADAIMTETNPEEAYAGLMKDADKLKLMLLAWNYQNSNAIRNGSEAPDLGVVGGLWAQYQNALALNAKQPSVSPINRTDQPSPIENQDETNSSGQKDEDDGSEDDSDDKLDQNAHDPERLKAFNMFVRLFVDENLDRMIPISKQPKEKIQAIIDSCARQFPEFCERSRKRIRTYLKSCRRNKKTREGWDSTSRPTPAHLTSVQAEQILAIACENESMNAKRMRIGLDPISQSLPLTTNNTVTTDVVAPSISYPGFRATPNTTAVSTTEMDTAQPSTTSQSIQSSARSSPISLTTTNPPVSVDVKVSNPPMNGVVTSQVASPLYRPAEFTSPSSTSSPYSVSAASRPPTTYPAFFPVANSVNVTPTDLSMKQHVQSTTQQSTQQLPTLATTNASSSVAAAGRPPLLSHKLNPNEISAVRQLITGYRESAAFLLRSADELEQLLLQQQ